MYGRIDIEGKVHLTERSSYPIIYLTRQPEGDCAAPTPAKISVI